MRALLSDLMPLPRPAEPADVDEFSTTKFNSSPVGVIVSDAATHSFPPSRVQNISDGNNIVALIKPPLCFLP